MSSIRTKYNICEKANTQHMSVEHGNNGPTAGPFGSETAHNLRHIIPGANRGTGNYFSSIVEELPRMAPNAISLTEQLGPHLVLV